MGKGPNIKKIENVAWKFATHFPKKKILKLKIGKLASAQGLRLKNVEIDPNGLEMVLGWTWRVNLPLMEGPTLMGDRKRSKISLFED